MKLVFIGGPFRGKNAWEIEENIRKAERLSLEVWRRGAACICPHTNTRFFQDAAPDAVWLQGYVSILKKCDALLLVPGWESSDGTQAEVTLAKEWGIPVFESVAELETWLGKKVPVFGKENEELTETVREMVDFCEGAQPEILDLNLEIGEAELTFALGRVDLDYTNLCFFICGDENVTNTMREKVNLHKKNMQSISVVSGLGILSGVTSPLEIKSFLSALGKELE